jgi:hypothetical protein
MRQCFLTVNNRPVQNVTRIFMLVESRKQSRFNGGCERALWRSLSGFWAVVVSSFVTHRFTDSSADSGRPFVQETLHLQGF